MVAAAVGVCVSTTQGTCMPPPDLLHEHRNTRPTGIIEKDLSLEKGVTLKNLLMQYKYMILIIL